MIEIQAKDQESFNFVVGELVDRCAKWKSLGGNRIRIDGGNVDDFYDLAESPAVIEFTWDPKNQIKPADEDDTVVPLSEEEIVAAKAEIAPERPPASGAGSSRDAWVEYANALGMEVPDDMSRDDIIAALEED